MKQPWNKSCVSVPSGFNKGVSEGLTDSSSSHLTDLGSTADSVIIPAKAVNFLQRLCVKHQNKDDLIKRCKQNALVLHVENLFESMMCFLVSDKL